MKYTKKRVDRGVENLQAKGEKKEGNLQVTSFFPSDSFEDARLRSGIASVFVIMLFDLEASTDNKRIKRYWSITISTRI